MSHHYTTRTAIDIRDRLESIADHLKRPEPPREDILRDMQEITGLVRRWSWFNADRKFADKVTSLLTAAQQTENGDALKAHVETFAATIRAVVDPF